jgi:hypothetical protein
MQFLNAFCDDNVPVIKCRLTRNSVENAVKVECKMAACYGYPYPWTPASNFLTNSEMKIPFGNVLNNT